MDVGIPATLLVPGFGELVFNILDGDAAGLDLGGGDVFAPRGLSDGGFIMQFTSGHSAPIRNPVENRPHKGGGIVHPFQRAAAVLTLDGLVVANNPTDRQTLYDALGAATDAILDADGRFLYTPPGQDTRFYTVRNYEALEIIGPGASPGGSPGGIAGPKQFHIVLVSENPYALSFTEDDTTIPNETLTPVPNAGTAKTWPVIEIYGPSTGWQIQNGAGFSIDWSGTIASGHHIEVDMLRETLYLDGNGANKLNGLDLSVSDFFAIPPGGDTWYISNPGAPSSLVKSNAAWAS